MRLSNVRMDARCRGWMGRFGTIGLWLVMVFHSAAAPSWYRGVLVGMEVGPTGAQFGHSATNDARYCARWDGEGIVASAADAQAEYLVLWARDGDYAYYDSKILPKAPGLGDRDPLRDAVRAAKSRRLPVIAYCVVQHADIS